MVIFDHIDQLDNKDDGTDVAFEISLVSLFFFIKVEPYSGIWTLMTLLFRMSSVKLKQAQRYLLLQFQLLGVQNWSGLHSKMLSNLPILSNISVYNRSCVICGIHDSVTRNRLSKKRRDIVFFKRDILLLEIVHCCRDHLSMRELSFKPLKKIEDSHADELFVNTDNIQKLLKDFPTCLASSRSFDFDDSSAMNDKAHVTITGLHKSEISFLFYYCT